MTLFAREHQHEPRNMLRDVLKLYMMHYAMTLPEAVEAITRDLQALVPEIVAERARRREGSP